MRAHLLPQVRTGGIDWRTGRTPVPGGLRRSPNFRIAADLNRDCRPDVLVGYGDAPGVIYFNDGTGKKYQPVPFGDGKGAINGLAAGDLNGDPTRPAKK
jgi:hypothetical protein